MSLGVRPSSKKKSKSPLRMEGNRAPFPPIRCSYRGQGPQPQVEPPHAGGGVRSDGGAVLLLAGSQGPDLLTSPRRRRTRTRRSCFLQMTPPLLAPPAANTRGCWLARLGCLRSGGLKSMSVFLVRRRHRCCSEEEPRTEPELLLGKRLQTIIRICEASFFERVALLLLINLPLRSTSKPPDFCL